MIDIDKLEQEIREMKDRLATKEDELDRLKLIHATEIYGSVTLIEEWSDDHLHREITARHTGNDLILINPVILEQFDIPQWHGTKFSIGGLDFELVHYMNVSPLWEARVLHSENGSENEK